MKDLLKSTKVEPKIESKPEVMGSKAFSLLMDPETGQWTVVELKFNLQSGRGLVVGKKACDSHSEAKEQFKIDVAATILRIG